MYKTILVPIDLTEVGSFTDKVVEQALGVLEAHGQLILLTVVPGYQMPLVGSFFPQGSFDSVVHHAEKELKRYVIEKLPVDPSECTLKVVEGKPADTILQVAEQCCADVIVMASHKQSRMERTVIGTIASKVVGRTDLPVLVVKG